MGTAEDEDLKYVLVIKDDVSSYRWLCPFHCADSDTALVSVGKQIACFEEMSWLVTGQGSHFRTLLMRIQTETLQIKYHPTTAYCPCANGTVETFCKEVLDKARAPLS